MIVEVSASSRDEQLNLLRVTFTDPATWTTSWTAALDLTSRPDHAGVFEYACHEGNYGMYNMLAASRLTDR